MPEVAFVVSPGQHHPLRELAATLGYELGLQGVTSALHLGAFPQPRADRVYVLIDPRGYVAAEGPEALPDDAILARTILVCVEPPPTDASDPDLAVMERAGAVFAIDARSIVALSRLGIRARLLRPGYSRMHDHFDPDADRPIDVTFLGSHSFRRTRYLSRAAGVLARMNCVVHVAGPEPAPGDMQSFPADSRWQLLAQTKVLINLHCGEQSRLEWRGALDAIHAGAVVVTEHSSGIAPLVAGEHLLVASPDALPFVAESLVRDADRLGALRAAAYERLSTWIPFALPVAVLRAAVVELVGEPIPPSVSLGIPQSASAAEPVAPAANGSRAPAAADVPVLTPAVASDEAPAVTVVTALSGAGGDDALIATLDSVAAGAMRDLELVIVADSTDDPPPAATAWIRAHPAIAARLVGAGAGTSLGAARNAGLAVARAPLCLVVEPGMELYPRGLGALARSLECHPDAAFAYSIQEVTGAPERFVQAGGDYLMSCVGWNAQRLRHGNYIHSPALIRTGVLRAVGGFAEEDALRGFEDYDLWCRIADRGGTAVRVAQMLARRAESEHSAVLATIDPAQGPPIRALVERAPALLAGAFTPAQ